MTKYGIAFIWTKYIVVVAVIKRTCEKFFALGHFGHIRPHIDCAVGRCKTAAAPVHPAATAAVARAVEPALITAHNFTNKTVINVAVGNCEAPDIALSFLSAVNLVNSPVIRRIQCEITGVIVTGGVQYCL